MAIFSQNAIKQGFFARQHRIGGKTYEVLTTFYAKQTQFPESQMNVSSYNRTDYENKSNWTLGQNKPNSNPNKPNLRKAKMDVNLYVIEDYRKKDDFIVRINKPNFRNAQK